MQDAQALDFPSGEHLCSANIVMVAFKVIIPSWEYLEGTLAKETIAVLVTKPSCCGRFCFILRVIGRGST